VRRLNTIALAVLLVLLGAYVYFFELSKDDKGKSDKLFNLKSEDVAGIALGYPRQEIQLRREATGQWRIIQPLQAPADDAAVAGLVAALSAGEIKRTLEKKPGAEDLKNFGLSPPAVKVAVTLKNGLTLPTLNVGARTPLGDSAYVQRGGEPGVYLTGAALAFALEKEPNDFRDKTLVPFPLEQAARLEIQTPGKSLVLAKGEKDEWTIEAAVKKNAKADAVIGYLATLTQLRARSFVDDQPADVKKYGLDRPTAKISVGAKDGTNLAVLEIGGKSVNTYYARREGNPTVYAIDESSYQTLQKAPEDFVGEEKAAPKK
jgi:uncharacterized protein DUF4340